MRSIVRVVAGLLFLLAVGYVGVVAVRRVLPRDLPGAGGPYAVGRTFREWTDTTRVDPLAPRPGRPRELAVWIWYPAKPGGPRAKYAPGLWDEQHAPTPLPGFGEGSFAAVRTEAVDGAVPAPGRFPLVVLLPGLGLDAVVFSTLAQSLAAHGYVVASVTPTYSANVTVLHGRVVEATAAGKPDDFDEAHALPLLRVWTADARFAAAEVAKELPGLADARHPLYAGHSFGGATAFQACHDDPACAGAVDLDGALHGTVTRDGVKAPALILGGDDSCVTGSCRETDPENAAMRAATLGVVAAGTGRVWRYELAGAQHFDFTDYAALYLAAPLRAAFPLGSIDGARALRIEDDYVVQFAEQAVRHRLAPLLAGARPYGEVRALG